MSAFFSKTIYMLFIFWSILLLYQSKKEILISSLSSHPCWSGCMKYIELILLDNSYYKVSIRLMLTSPYFAFHLKYTVHTLYFSDWNFGLYVTLKEKKSPMLVKQVLVLGTCYKTNLSMKVQNRTWPSTFTFNRLWKKNYTKKTHENVHSVNKNFEKY